MKAIELKAIGGGGGGEGGINGRGSNFVVGLLYSKINIIEF